MTTAGTYKGFTIQNAALVDRDAKIKVLINALAIATRSAAQNSPTEGN